MAVHGRRASPVRRKLRLPRHPVLDLTPPPVIPYSMRIAGWLSCLSGKSAIGTRAHRDARFDGAFEGGARVFLATPRGCGTLMLIDYDLQTSDLHPRSSRPIRRRLISQTRELCKRSRHTFSVALLERCCESETTIISFVPPAKLRLTKRCGKTTSTPRTVPSGSLGGSEYFDMLAQPAQPPFFPRLPLCMIMLSTMASQHCSGKFYWDVTTFPANVPTTEDPPSAAHRRRWIPCNGRFKAVPRRSASSGATSSRRGSRRGQKEVGFAAPHSKRSASFFTAPRRFDGTKEYLAAPRSTR